jgi:putative hydrolase of the HAD superfamily
LFDLDDTLFDHGQAARTALVCVHRTHEVFTRWPFDAFAEAHARVLEELHLDVLAGARTVDAAREERFRRLVSESGGGDDGERVRATAALYREAYLAARRPVAGARAVLAALKPLVQIGIVSNNLLEEQQAKVRLCGFDEYVDVLVVSEVVGVSKPDPVIFARALEELGCEACDAVMIGDSWTADIEGARAAGIRAIWFNPSGRRPPDPTTDVCEISTLAPTDAIMTAIFNRGMPSDFGADFRCASA